MRGRADEERKKKRKSRGGERLSEKKEIARVRFSDLALSLSRARSGSKERKKRKKLFPSPTHLEVSRRARQRLHVDAPLLRVEAEGRQRTVLAEGLGLVDELVAAVVAGA